MPEIYNFVGDCMLGVTVRQVIVLLFFVVKVPVKENPHNVMYCEATIIRKHPVRKCMLRAVLLKFDRNTYLAQAVDIMMAQ